MQVGLVPEDASKTEQMLRQASINLVKGGGSEASEYGDRLIAVVGDGRCHVLRLGELKIFTPMYYVVAEKI